MAKAKDKDEAKTTPPSGAGPSTSAGGGAPFVPHEWLDLELKQIWLLAERLLRDLQQTKLRPASDHPTLAEVETVLSARRHQRSGDPRYREEELTAALKAAEEKLATVGREVGQRMLDRLDLRPHEVAAAVISLAPSIDPPLAELFSVLRGSTIRRGVDLALISQLLRFQRDNRIELLDILDEERPLIKQRLIQPVPAQDIFSSIMYRAIQPTPDLVWVLTGKEGTLASVNRRNCQLWASAPPNLDGLILDDEVRQAVERTGAAWKAASAAGKEVPWVSLWGARGAGKRSIASRLAAMGGKPLVTLSVALVEKPQFVEAFRRAQRDAKWLGAALYVGPLGSDYLTNEGKELFEWIGNCEVPLFLGIEAMAAPRLRITHALSELGLTGPNLKNRIALWAQKLNVDPEDPALKLERLSLGYKLTPGEVGELAEEAKVVAPAGVDSAALLACVERRMRSEMGDVAKRMNVHTSWNDVVLPDVTTARVREFIHRKMFENRVYQDWGFASQVQYGRGLVALFSGSPGTGKTLLAGLIANELGLEMYQVDLSQIFSRWVGETEKSLGKLFDQAERAHAVLLFDEADALFAKRTEVTDSRDRYANVTVNYLLQRLEQYSGVAILTTNKDAYLDDALRRRLSLQLRIEDPEEPERLRLWRKHMPLTMPGVETVDLGVLARDYEVTGGYIKNIAMRAAFMAAAMSTPVSTELVQRAALFEMEDMGHVVFESKDGRTSLNQSSWVDFTEG